MRPHGTRAAEPPLIYIHIDPETRGLLYIGSSSNRARHRDFSRRKWPHRMALQGLLCRGWSPDQIAFVVANGISSPAVATRLKASLVAILDPPMNRRGRALWQVNPLPAPRTRDPETLPLAARSSPDVDQVEEARNMLRSPA